MEAHPLLLAFCHVMSLAAVFLTVRVLTGCPEAAHGARSWSLAPALAEAVARDG